jgi:hypothetical protein
MFQNIFASGSLFRLGQDLATDFGPAFSLLISVLAVGAWVLGLQFETGQSSAL